MKSKNRVLVVVSSVAVVAACTGAIGALSGKAKADGYPACSIQNLRLDDFHGGGEADVAYYTPVVENVGAATCSVSGFPTLQLRDASGNALPTTVTDGVAGLTEDQSGTPVVLATGSLASVTFTFRDDPTQGTDCATASTIDIGIPGGGTYTLQRSLSPCSGAIAVSSFQPGDNLPY